MCIFWFSISITAFVEGGYPDLLSVLTGIILTNSTIVVCTYQIIKAIKAK